MNVDPVDDCTFWMTNEYHKVDNSGVLWNTRIGSFLTPGCSENNREFPWAIFLAPITNSAKP